MDLQTILQQFITGMKNTTLPEYIAVFTGIASVYFSRLENIWVYPTGLVNTIIYIWLSVKAHLFGEASVNLYYTIMSIYGWILWAKKDKQHHHLVHIRFSSSKLWVYQWLFFGACYAAMYFILKYLEQSFSKDVIPWADALASASAFTGMWLMARKKVESWYWWIITNIASIPLYFVKGYVFTSVYYLVLLVMAVFGLLEWMRRAEARVKVGGIGQQA